MVVKFRALIRYWDPSKGSGLAVADIPAEHIVALGGLKQRKVRGTINGAEYQSSVMPAGGGRLALSVSKAMMTAGGAKLGDAADFEVEPGPKGALL